MTSDLCMALFPLLFPPFFVCMWLGVAKLLSWMGGWQRLAGSMRAEPPFGRPLASRWMCSGEFGWVTYNNVLNVQFYDDYMVLSPVFFFRFGHPPIKIAKETVRTGEFRSGWFGQNTYGFRVEGVQVQLRGRIAAQVRDWAK